MAKAKNAVSLGISALIVIVIILIVGFGLFLNATFNTISTPSISSNSYSYTFSIQVNYSGDWKLTYWGSRLAGCPPSPAEVNGYYLTRTFSGQGSNTTSVTLSGATNQGLSLSVLAQKLDASNTTLSIVVNNVGHNSTSLPYGSAYTCSGVVP